MTKRLIFRIECGPDYCEECEHLCDLDGSGEEFKCSLLGEFLEQDEETGSTLRCTECCDAEEMFYD